MFYHPGKVLSQFAMSSTYQLNITVPSALVAAREAEYVAAVLEELRVGRTLRQWHTRELGGIRFACEGSGFTGAALARLMSGIETLGLLRANLPVIFDVAPVGVGRNEVTALLDAGLTAVQVRVQSLDSEILKIIGSPEDPAEISAAFRTWQLDRRNFVGASFVYGVPRQTVEQFRNDLARLIVLNPDFVSYRPLALVPGSLVDRDYSVWWRRHHLIKMPMMMKMRSMVQAVMSGLNLLEHELHQFAAPDAHSTFFQPLESDILGLGVGAASRYIDISDQPIRTKNEAVLEQYLQRILVSGSAVAQQSVLSREQQIYEFMGAGFRSRRAISLLELEFKFGVKFDEQTSSLIEVLRAGGYLEQTGDILELTESGTVAFEDIVGQMSGVGGG